MQSLYVIFYGKKVQDSNDELAAEQPVQIPLYTDGGNEQKYKHKPDQKCCDLKEKGNACFAETMQDAGKDTGEIKERADEAERDDK